MPGGISGKPGANRSDAAAYSAASARSSSARGFRTHFRSAWGSDRRRSEPRQTLYFPSNVNAFSELWRGSNWVPKHSDVVALRVEDVAPSGYAVDRETRLGLQLLSYSETIDVAGVTEPAECEFCVTSAIRLPAASVTPCMTGRSDRVCAARPPIRASSGRCGR